MYSEALKNHGWINRQSETNVQWSLKIFSLFDAEQPRKLNFSQINTDVRTDKVDYRVAFLRKRYFDRSPKHLLSRTKL